MIKNELKKSYEDVDASPVKSFFVSMLTRDIKLEEAILDLLDNCVDGILRTKGNKIKTKKPYEGFWAKIDFSKDSFAISDNCGGIPWNLHEYAFRMGRPKGREHEAKKTVGVYGIGMKRAIFKMGRNCLISTQNGENNYEVEIKSDWIADEENWHIPVTLGKRTMKEDGTTILITKLNSGISSSFGDRVKDFKRQIEQMVATHYAFIMDKGFEVKINGDEVKPKPTRLIFNKSLPGRNTTSIRPFIFKTRTDDGVEVFLTVGFTGPIPSKDEADSEQDAKKHSSENAGWTVVCNDRAVLYCDRTELTGWGEAGIPRYHTQFIAISGIVEFTSDDASKLPTTTTKRNIDTSSPLYLQIKNKMREGMRIFTDYTNKWKGRSEESAKHIHAGEKLSFDEIKAEAKTLHFISTKRSFPAGNQYKPELPLPKIEASTRRISFIKDKDDIECVADHLFGDKEKDPSVVGEKCFDLILRESRK